MDTIAKFLKGLGWVVIVEDDINMRKSLEIALAEYEEFNIKSYKSATEALKK